MVKDNSSSDQFKTTLSLSTSAMWASSAACESDSCEKIESMVKLANVRYKNVKIYDSRSLLELALSKSYS
jgi:hypothetical protein